MGCGGDACPDAGGAGLLLRWHAPVAAQRWQLHCQPAAYRWVPAPGSAWAQGKWWSHCTSARGGSGGRPLAALAARSAARMCARVPAAGLGRCRRSSWTHHKVAHFHLLHRALTERGQPARADGTMTDPARRDRQAPHVSIHAFTALLVTSHLARLAAWSSGSPRPSSSESRCGVPGSSVAMLDTADCHCWPQGAAARCRQARDRFLPPLNPVERTSHGAGNKCSHGCRGLLAMAALVSGLAGWGRLPRSCAPARATA